MTVKLSLLPTVNDDDVLLKIISPYVVEPPELFAVAVTAHVAVLLPSTVLTVIVAEPLEFAVTTPFELTLIFDY